ncbi:MAG: exonuclease domain-containing protein [Gemmatimonadota bacterium]|nr:exonuclease domain-containing protein [Gemmatimonadota bacterium]
MSLVFYDTETTGISTSFDQILQFGAIRTDTELKEIDRFSTRSRLQGRVLAHPKALFVTGVTVAQLTDSSLPSHYEMMRTIQRQLNGWSPSVFIGYNSLSFDEHLLRSALWKTLHSPYLTNTDGNSRADAMKMVQAVSILRPDIFSIPTGEKGGPSFKLDAIAPANGFDHSSAHDAIGDVSATIHLCGLIAERAPDLWSDFMRFAQKAAVLDFAENEPAFGLIEFRYNKPYVYLLTMIGRNRANQAELYAYDLGVDPAELSGLTDEGLSSRINESPRLFRRIKANAAPILITLDGVPAIAASRSLGNDELLRRAGLVATDSALGARIVAAIERDERPKSPSEHIEEQIYDGFASREDMAVADSFHQKPWEDRAATIDQLADGRLKVLARRLLYDKDPELLRPDARDAERRLISERLLSGATDLPWCTLTQAIADCRKLISAQPAGEAEHLRDYLAYCESRQEELRALD